MSQCHCVASITGTHLTNTAGAFHDIVMPLYPVGDSFITQMRVRPRDLDALWLRPRSLVAGWGGGGWRGHGGSAFAPE